MLFQRLLAGLLLVVLSGCASLSPAAMTRLAGLDVLTADPADLSVAAVMPVPLRLRTGDVVMSLSFVVPSPDVSVAETLALEIVDGGGVPGIALNRRFERLQFARVAQADLARLAAAQAKVRAFREAGGQGGKGSFSVMVKGACRDGLLGEQPLIGAIYMRTDPAGSYFAAVKPLNLTTLVGDDALRRLEPCAGAGTAQGRAE